MTPAIILARGNRLVTPTPSTSHPDKKIRITILSLILFTATVGAQENAPAIQAPPQGTPSANTSGSGSQIDGLIRAANQAIRNRDYSTGSQLLEQVVSIDPHYKNGWNYLGWTYNALGQYSKAEAALRKAIADNPADPQAYNNLGQSLAYRRKYDEAIPQYMKQIEIRPKDPWAHTNLGRVYLMTKQYDKAISELEISIEHYAGRCEYLLPARARTGESESTQKRRHRLLRNQRNCNQCLFAGMTWRTSYPNKNWTCHWRKNILNTRSQLQSYRCATPRWIKSVKKTLP